MGCPCKNVANTIAFSPSTTHRFKQYDKYRVPNAQKQSVHLRWRYKWQNSAKHTKAKESISIGFKIEN